MGAAIAALFGRDSPEVAEAIEVNLRGNVVRLSHTYAVYIYGEASPCAYGAIGLW